MKTKSRKKYIIIAKCRFNNVDTFVKYRTNHIEKTIAFIDAKFNYSLMWANIYSNRGHSIRDQIGSYGKKKGLMMI
jgi:hypothetical protein